VGCQVTHFGDDVALGARSTIEHLLLTAAPVTTSITKPYSPGDGGCYEGGSTTEVTELLVDYTTFASLPRRLNEVFLKVNGNFMWLQKAALCGFQFGSLLNKSGNQVHASMKRKNIWCAVGAGIILLAGRSATIIVAENANPRSGPDGMVWERHGDWHLNGSSDTLRLGEAVPPGGLMTAGALGSTHSLIILLPDGQRLLCECYEAKTCAQGFRVPPITPQPTPAIWDMFVAVRNVLLLRPAAAETVFPQPTGRAEMAGNFEMVAAIGPQGEISIAPALRVLPAGQYSLSVMKEAQPPEPSTTPAVQPLAWNPVQARAQVQAGGIGLYHIRVSDQAYVPRIEIEVLATSPASYPSEFAKLKQTRETIQNWSRIQQGWPLHPFLRVYLESRSAQ
jgi:hypothetical protein